LDKSEQDVFLKQFRGAAFHIVALAASAGGLAALAAVLSGLPDDFPAALVIVQHLDPRHRSLMADILSRRTKLKVKQAAEGDRLSPGIAYIAHLTDTCWSILMGACPCPNPN